MTLISFVIRRMRFGPADLMNSATAKAHRPHEIGLKWRAVRLKIRI